MVKPRTVLLGLLLLAQAETVAVADVATVQALIAEQRWAEAEAAAREALAEVEARHGARSREAAEIVLLLVRTLGRQRRQAEPETLVLAERAVAIHEELDGADAVALVKPLTTLASVASGAGDEPRARQLCDRAVAIVEARGAPDAEAAIELYTMSGVLASKRKDFSTGERYFVRALEIAEEAFGADDDRTLRTISNVALNARQGQRPDRALEFYRRRLAIEERRFGSVSPPTVDTWIQIGFSQLGRGDLAQGREAFLRSSEIAAEALGPDHLEVARGLQFAAGQADTLTAVAWLGRALEIFETNFGPDSPRLIPLLSNLAAAVDMSGDPSRALEYGERALALAEAAVGPANPRLVGPLSELVGIRLSTGQLAEARSTAERMVALVDGVPDADDRARSDAHRSLSRVLAALGELEPALDHAKQAREFDLRAWRGDNSLAAATDTHHIARLYRDLGNPEQARRYYDESLEISRAQQAPFAAAQVDLAEWAWEEGNLEDAASRFGEIVASRARVRGEDDPGAVYPMRCLALVLAEQGKFDEAAEWIDAARRLQRRLFGESHWDLAWTHRAAAAVALHGGDPTTAMDAALDAERIGAEHTRLIAGAMSEGQALRFSAARRASALDLVLTAALASPQSPIVTRAWDAVVSSRALVLDVVAQRNRLSGSSPDEETLRLQADYRVAAGRYANYAVAGQGEQRLEDYREVLRELRLSMERAERALAAHSQAFAAQVELRNRTAADVVAALPPSSALVSYVVFDRFPDGVPTVAAFVKPAGASPVRLLNLGPTGEIERVIADWRREVSRPLSDAGAAPRELERSYRRAALALRQRIWDPVAAWLGDPPEILFVVPDGDLGLVSFATLPLVGQSYLVEWGPTVHYLSAERDLVRDVRPPGEGFLMVGGVDYDTAADTAAAEAPGLPSTALRSATSGCRQLGDLRFETLSGTSREVEAIAAIFNASDPTAADDPVITLRGAGASETAIKSLAPGRRVLHLATHGFFLGECFAAMNGSRGIGGLGSLATKGGGSPTDLRPAASVGDNPLLLSGLVLAGGNANGDGRIDDGILTAQEIAALPLAGVEWAVLSACDTGLGEVMAGEGILGLRRSLRVAGVATSILSLWSVDDESTIAWMRLLYEARFRDGRSSAEAVHAATTTYLDARREAGQSTHPFFWGAFVGAGDWR